MNDIFPFQEGVHLQWTFDMDWDEGNGIWKRKSLLEDCNMYPPWNKHIFAHANGFPEWNRFLLGWPIFRCELLVSRWVSSGGGFIFFIFSPKFADDSLFDSYFSRQISTGCTVREFCSSTKLRTSEWVFDRKLLSDCHWFSLTWKVNDLRKISRSGGIFQKHSPLYLPDS